MSEHERSAKGRQYQMRKRAEQMDGTRQRIVEATSHLHATVGPARTTIAGIAEKAGVTRLTVYKHFPDEVDLYNACSTHWRSNQQLPDPAAWSKVSDPYERLRLGLSDTYRFYREGADMLERLYRDKDVLPEGLQQSLQERDGYFRDVLLEPFSDRRDDATLRALIGHAVSFWTWHSLCSQNGLAEDAAVEAMVALAGAAPVG
ncbi:TetR/AcrR family transcriptional regulator [Arthrobacter sp. P2b]|uniref:TetR/AcrR family transcriptional regulator n=1 Tax=Arthrobacter sp. P2b TaxID=1938741 RepID=UPI0009C8E77B|nr:TetR family transcriptional regulator [Arthrobacter sp. P2b]SLJ94938.1 transcriptional regulator, TetR family [Arthrobacter sp. P2b]